MKTVNDLTIEQLRDFVEGVQEHAQFCAWLEDSEGFLEGTRDGLEKLELDLTPKSPFDDDEEEADEPEDVASGW